MPVIDAQLHSFSPFFHFLSIIKSKMYSFHLLVNSLLDCLKHEGIVLAIFGATENVVSQIILFYGIASLSEDYLPVVVQSNIFLLPSFQVIA